MCAFRCFAKVQLYMKRGKRSSTQDLRQMQVVPCRGQHRHQQPQNRINTNMLKLYLIISLSLRIIHGVPNLLFRGFGDVSSFPRVFFLSFPLEKSEIHPAAQLLQQILHRSCWGDPQNPRHISAVQAEPPGTRLRRNHSLRLGDVETWLKHG